MNKEKMKTKIQTYINDLEGVSFTELTRELGKQSQGDYHINIGENIILYINLSKQFVDCVIELLEEEKIFISTTTMLTYMLDGNCIDLPVAKRYPKGGYKKPHWLPTVFYSTKQKDSLDYSKFKN